MEITVRYADRAELPRVNELRKMVNELHANGRPDIFRPGFCAELQQHVYQKFDSDAADVIVALADGVVCGFAIAEYIYRPESPYIFARRFYHIEEFGVDAAFRRKGAATALIAFCRQEAARTRFDRIELDVWSFNEEALKFYEAVGFQTYRRFMALPATQECAQT